jgi:hypothetical protein
MQQEEVVTMAFIYRKRIRMGKRGSINLSKSGISASERLGPLTVNSRGRISLRLLPGLTFRFGGKKWR